jgi:hypothetical protein
MFDLMPRTMTNPLIRKECSHRTIGRGKEKSALAFQDAPLKHLAIARGKHLQRGNSACDARRKSARRIPTAR